MNFVYDFMPSVSEMMVAEELVLFGRKVDCTKKAMYVMENISEAKNEIAIVDKETVENLIYIVRGQKVMLDADLAKIYGYSTKAFNQQVKNNIEKFEEDFMFLLTDEEVKELSRSKILTLNNEGGRGHNIKYNPHSFKESGLTVLRG